MVCWVVPFIAAISGFARPKGRGKGFWLNIMLLGGAIFGMIDHAWNGELFMIGPNIAGDLALGAAITAGITASWAIMAFKPDMEGMAKQMRMRLGMLKV